jgi:hypothetical protein
LDIAAICGAIVVIVTATTLIAKLPPVRWLWRHLISDPLGGWASRVISDGAAEFHESTVRPQIVDISAKVDELLAQGETSWHKDKAWIVSRLTRLEERQRQLIAGIVTVLERPGLQTDGVVRSVIEALNGYAEEKPPSPPSPPGGPIVLPDD